MQINLNAIFWFITSGNISNINLIDTAEESKHINHSKSKIRQKKSENLA